MTTATPESHRVLVVDDEPNIADVISMALGFQGFTVESAGDGRTALEAVATFKPDLLVLDVMLPDMEGFEIARRLNNGIWIEDFRGGSAQVAAGTFRLPFTRARRVRRGRFTEELGAGVLAGRTLEALQGSASQADRPARSETADALVALYRRRHAEFWPTLAL